MTDVRRARSAAVERLAAAGVETPDLDARRLLEAATGLASSALAAEPTRILSPEEETRFEALLKQRLARRPMSQIEGRVGFWTLELAVTSDVLTPRPETETVLEAALAETADRKTGRVLDLGVGSGTLLLAFLSERPGWSGVGVDLSAAALAVASANMRALNLQGHAALVQGDWDAGLDPGAGFDLVLSNPPYVTTAELSELAPEVRDHEPRLALDGGADGLNSYRRLAPRLSRLMASDGAAVFEIGTGQGPAVAELFKTAVEGASVRIVPDLDGRDRAVVVRRTQ
jgi:release factor glutamine methyltransferase